MSHHKVSDPINSWVIFSAILVILFSTIVELHIAFILSIGVALLFAAMKVFQSRRLFEKRGEKS